MLGGDRQLAQRAATAREGAVKEEGKKKQLYVCVCVRMRLRDEGKKKLRFINGDVL